MVVWGCLRKYMREEGKRKAKGKMKEKSVWMQSSKG